MNRAKDFLLRWLASRLMAAIVLAGNGAYCFCHSRPLPEVGLSNIEVRLSIRREPRGE